MSLMADELIRFSSVLRIAYNFLTGRNYLKRKKFREKKKLIAIALPFSDLAFAAGAIQVFPIRMHQFEIHKYHGHGIGCIETGIFEISNDSITLYQESDEYIPEFNFRKLIIEKDKAIITIFNIENQVDTIRYFKIQETTLANKQ